MQLLLCVDASGARYLLEGSVYTLRERQTCPDCRSPFVTLEGIPLPKPFSVSACKPSARRAEGAGRLGRGYVAYKASRFIPLNDPSADLSEERKEGLVKAGGFI